VGDLRSRVIHLADGQDRADARNLRTGVVIGEESIAPAGRFAELFGIAWPELRRMLLGFAQPGVAVVAVDAIRHRVAGTLALAARVGRANAAVIGRHGRCDLYLHADAAMALRHMVLIAHPLSAEQAASREVTYRLLDLRTRTAFCDEGGRRLEALTASGPTFVRVGTYVLFLLCTGEAGPWPEDAKEAWACVPERVYVEETEAEPDRWRRRHGGMVMGPTQGPLAAGTGVVDPFGRESVTWVRTSPGPSRARVDAAPSPDGEPPVGRLRLRAGGRSESLTVSAAAARTGVLVGRYERCDTHGATCLAHHGISRVHVLVVEIEGALYAIDTGSTNGVYEGGADVRVAPLAAGSELVLGDDLARVEWHPT
jgi:FHA domain